MNLPQLKEWCKELALYKVKTNAGYGEDKYVIATDFNDAAEKVREFYIREDEKENTPTVGNTTHINSTPKGKTVKIKEVELIAENIIL